jgi:hypothetical protein
MNKLPILVFFILFGMSALAQTVAQDSSIKTITMADLGLQGIGFTYEPRLTNQISMELSFGAGAGYGISESSVHYRFYLTDPAFYFSATPKFYYNRKSRIARGKKYMLNSGDYLGIGFKYNTSGVTSDDRIRQATLINLHWGMQRSITERWIVNAHTGVGYATDLDSGFGTIYPAIGLKLSYVLASR